MTRALIVFLAAGFIAGFLVGFGCALAMRTSEAER